MTLRAVILGLLGVLFIAAFGYINDRVLGLESFNSGQFLAVFVFGTLMIVSTVINPLLHRVRRSLAFRPAELAVWVGILLAVVGIPGRGLTEQFSQVLAMPAHWYKLSPGWRKNELHKYIPEAVYPADGKYDPEVHEQFVQGHRSAKRPIGPGDVPWGKWSRCLRLWIPVVLLTAGCSVCLALIVHQQWSRNERLRYPIATFATSLLDRREGLAFADIFRHKGFWIGLILILLIRGINHTNTWMQGDFIQVKLSFWFGQIPEKFQILDSVKILFWVPLFPAAIAFSFFLASEISLTLGLSQYIWSAVLVVCITFFGTNLRTDYELGGPIGWARGGAYVAMGLTLLYIGRAYYGDVLAAAFGARGRRVDPAAVWACRIFLACFVALVVIVAMLGLPWPIGVMLMALVLLMFLCVARISAETGLFFIQAGWQPVGLLLGALGGYALGPRAIVISGVVCMVLCARASMALLPYLVHVLRITDRARVTPGKMGWTSMGAYALAVVIAVPVTIWACYNFSSPSHDYYFKRLPTVPLRAANEAVTELKLSDELEASEGLGTLERLTSARPKQGFVPWALAGFVLVLACAALRLRLTWWPIHPVLFLVWATWPMQLLGHSFMVGWILKTLVVRLGGTRLYDRWKPAMLGIVAGEMLCGVLMMILGAVYYFATGIRAPISSVFPR